MSETTPLLHEPETVTVLEGACAQELCEHDASPGNDCQWREIEVCSACSYEGVDLGTADRVAVTPWPCASAVSA